ncbi:translation initiation factor eIF-2B epsilon subunit, GEF [Coemansia interrupta]|uniref:Translation initiation factor eIF2B subunit epsilon n=1 Tax=Coemansia interrupta TaxID=1126814 RepID=A0A9W8LNI8_9FUNG|nr:translation initiation factor eIF-2B epsilon subunit, GEF [Coemansia interrupta]
MAPSKAGSGHDKNDHEQLMAIVMADSFDDLFQPLSLNKPRCLLPLCNVPMIEYTLEFLASSGVNETLVVCKSHAEAIKTYIKQSKWARTHSPMKVKTKVVQQSRTVGEALREIDDAPFRSDFILCTGVVISNMNLAPIMEMHSANGKRDKDQVMTMILQEATPQHRLRDKSDESVYIIDPSNNRLLSVDSLPSVPKANHLDIPLNTIVEAAEVEIRADLIDTNVYICSPEVLELFRDNFDYQTMRSDFIHFISISTLDSSTFYAHILTGTSGLDGLRLDDGNGVDARDGGGSDFTAVSHSGYLAGVIDTSSYDAISRDMISRWTYPLCPDSNPVDETAYSYNRGAVYKAEPVFLGRESRVEHRVILGSNSHVADFARVADTVLGKNCGIGERSLVRGSYLFDNAKVSRGSVVEKSILGERVTILDNVVIERGCLIGDDVVIGPNVRIPEFTRIGRRQPQKEEDSGFSDDDDSDDGSSAAATGRSGTANAGGVLSPGRAESETFDTQALGASGVGYVWSSGGAGSDDDDDFDDFDDDKEHGITRDWIRKLHRIGTESSDIAVADEEISRERAQSQAAELTPRAAEHAPEESFEHELRLTIKRSFEDNLDIEIASFEINNLRFTLNGNQDDMRRVIMQEILKFIDVGELPGSAKAAISRWGGLVKKTLSSNLEQVMVVECVERFCALDSAVDAGARGRLFVLALRFLYEFDIIEDLAIIYWHNKASEKVANGGEGVSADLVQKAAAFVEWLEEESDDDDDSEEDDDDSEDDEESESE